MKQAGRTIFRLEGLDCPDCAAKLEKKIGGLPGVAEARVNFCASRMTVRSAKIEDILDAVKEAGYGADVEVG